MREEIEKLKKSTTGVEAKVGYLKESVNGLESAIKELTTDLDAFIEVYTTEQDSINERLKRIEKHIGFS